MLKIILCVSVNEMENETLKMFLTLRRYQKVYMSRGSKHRKGKECNIVTNF